MGSGTTVNVLSTVIGNFDIDGASDGVGTLNLYDDLILVTGNIGDTHKLQKVLIDTNTLSLAQGDLNATTTVLKGTGTVEYYAGDSNFLTNFVAYADGDGTIRSNPNGGATSIFTGNIGTSSASIGTFEFLDNVAVDHAQFNGNVYVNQILMGTDDTLDFFGSGTQVVSGTIDGVAGGGESINVGVGNANHVVKFLGEIGGSNAIDLIYVDPNSTAQFMQDVTLTGSMASDGTTSLAAGKTISANSISGNGTYVIGVKDAGTLGTLETADIGVLNSAGNINLGSADVQFNVTGGVAEGTLLSAFTGGGVATDAVSVTDNSLLYSFALTANGSNFDLDVTKAAISSVGVDSGNTGVGEVLDSLSSTSDTSLGQVISNLAIASTVGELNDMLDATKPSVDSGSVQTSLDVADQHNLMAQNRVKGLRHGETGASSGDVTDGLKAWFQGFVRGSEQDARKGADGYSADSHGFSIGVDSDRIAKDATVGIALGYADSHIKSDNVNTTKSDMNSYNISVYGDYEINSRTYVSGNVSYSHNTIDQVRHNVGGVAGLNADADFDADQYGLYVEAGHDIPLFSKTIFSPKALMNYQHLSIDDYSEKGAGGAGLDVESDDLDVFEIGLGAEVSWDFITDSGARLRPSLNTGYRYDLIGDSIDATSTFIAGGSAFSTDGVDPAQGTFNVGAAISYAMDDNWELSADYGVEVKDEYNSHTGHIRADYKF